MSLILHQYGWFSSKQHSLLAEAIVDEGCFGHWRLLHDNDLGHDEGSNELLLVVGDGMVHNYMWGDWHSLLSTMSSGAPSKQPAVTTTPTTATPAATTATTPAATTTATTTPAATATNVVTLAGAAPTVDPEVDEAVAMAELEKYHSAENFISLHSAQFTKMGLPQKLWRRVHAKLYGGEYDATDAFAVQFVEDEGRRRLACASEEGLKAGADVWVIDHGISHRPSVLVILRIANIRWDVHMP